MQIKYSHKCIYKLYKYGRKQEALDFYRKPHLKRVEAWEKFKAKGLNDKLVSEIVGFSRATYFRSKKRLTELNQGIIPPSKAPKKVNKPKWGESEKQLVLQIRRANPTYGKAKICIILKRDYGCNISESTVGRILTHLTGKHLITRSISAARTRKKRNFNNKHAKAWTYKKYENIEMGERIQIDHMTVTKNNVSMKHFQAWDRRTRFMHAELYSNAKATSAKKFLDSLIKTCPFKIKSIQVDGGSEFMAEFEQACADYKFELIVLPPAKPTYNGGVERGNRIFREELYHKVKFADSIGAFRIELKKALFKYNHYRPHHGLKGFTPMEYINNMNLGGNVSHSA